MFDKELFAGAQTMWYISLTEEYTNVIMYPMAHNNAFLDPLITSFTNLREPTVIRFAGALTNAPLLFPCTNIALPDAPREICAASLCKVPAINGADFSETMEYLHSVVLGLSSKDPRNFKSVEDKQVLWSVPLDFMLKQEGTTIPFDKLGFKLPGGLIEQHPLYNLFSKQNIGVQDFCAAVVDPTIWCENNGRLSYSSMFSIVTGAELDETLQVINFLNKGSAHSCFAEEPWGYDRVYINKVLKKGGLPEVCDTNSGLAGLRFVAKTLSAPLDDFEFKLKCKDPANRAEEILQNQIVYLANLWVSKTEEHCDHWVTTEGTEYVDDLLDELTGDTIYKLPLN